MRIFGVFAAGLVLLIAGVTVVSVSAADRSFFTGAAGTLPSDPKERAQTYFRARQVRAVLAQMEVRPLSKAELLAHLQGSNISIGDLVRTRIVRQTARGYVIGFNYFTLSDMKKIHATAEKYVPSLVAVYKAHDRDLDRIFSSYAVKSVPRRRLATVLLAGFALNWDGLTITEQLGYRRPEPVIGPGWKYSFFASEEDPSYSEHGFIWGSSSLFGLHDNFTYEPVDFEFSSFGDPYSDPRMNLPDVFAMSPKDMTPDVAQAVLDVGLIDETYFGSHFSGVLGPRRARSIGPMLFALRSRPLTASALSKFIEPNDRSHAAAFVRLLLTMDYIRARPDGQYELITPVFDRGDAKMLDEALALNRSILKHWLRRIYPRLKVELSTITPVREGVPFQSAFTQIWHEYFGLATRQMTAAGLIEDPYSKTRRHPGSVAVVWRRALYHFDPG